MANVEGKVTNHSVRATSATTMSQTGVPEKSFKDALDIVP